ncbi:hypothetical protein ACJ73_04531 [Blastomyces percursus]|uniref:Uncharacterized protein n=1 Tax=Blastomyces percursus TaxID=1658174 RepID=A0A1J9Q7R3_9EURO|nr:hypothetical protein ACJ73_04531 [Blastomyces percursus]
MFSKRKPHQALSMISDHQEDECISLLLSVILGRTMIMSMNLFRVRILRSHFIAASDVHWSKMYDFAMDNHEDAMKIAVGYLRSTPYGDTTPSTQMSINAHDDGYNDDDNKDEDVVQTGWE